MSGKQTQTIQGVAETLFIPLHARAIEAQRQDPLLKDEQSVSIVSKLDYDFSRIRLQDHDKVAMILRIMEFDRFVRDFLIRFPEAAVVHIGCGLDTRFERVDNGLVQWFDLDLPEVIDLRREVIGIENNRYNLIARSVFDDAWVRDLNPYRKRPFLFVAEGVLPYFEEIQVKALVAKIQNCFPGSEMVFDAFTPVMHWLDNLHLVLSGFKPRLHWGLKNPREIETWGNSIRLLEEYYYFNRPQPRLGLFQLMRYLPVLAKSTGIFHYRLGNGIDS